VQVTAINRAAHTVEVSDGSTIAYSKLLLATGAANRELTGPGSGLEGIYGLCPGDDWAAIAFFEFGSSKSSRSAPVTSPTRAMSKSAGRTASR
jgi:NAD(P)H-nitrite reductase large subunit